MDDKRKSELNNAALLMRFQSHKPSSMSRKYVSYKNIAKTLNITENEVQYICIMALKPENILNKKQLIRKLDTEHINFLLDPCTLEKWAGHTMK